MPPPPSKLVDKVGDIILFKLNVIQILSVHWVFFMFWPIILNRIFNKMAVIEPHTIPFDVNIATLGGSESKIPGTTDTPTPRPTATAAIIAFSADSAITGTNMPIPCVITIPNIASIAAPSTGVGMIVVNAASFGKKPKYYK